MSWLHRLGWITSIIPNLMPAMLNLTESTWTFLWHMPIDSESGNRAWAGTSTLLISMVSQWHNILWLLNLTWNFVHAHLGGTIERWEDPYFRRCFEDMFTGRWRQHDPFALEGRLDARSSLYGRPGQSSIFRSFQGWLAMRYGCYILLTDIWCYC